MWHASRDCILLLSAVAVFSPTQLGTSHRWTTARQFCPHAVVLLTQPKRNFDFSDYFRRHAIQQRRLVDPFREGVLRGWNQ